MSRTAIRAFYAPRGVVLRGDAPGHEEGHTSLSKYRGKLGTNHVPFTGSNELADRPISLLALPEGNDDAPSRVNRRHGDFGRLILGRDAIPSFTRTGFRVREDATFIRGRNEATRKRRRAGSSSFETADIIDLAFLDASAGQNDVLRRRPESNSGESIVSSKLHGRLALPSTFPSTRPFDVLSSLLASNVFFFFFENEIS